MIIESATTAESSDSIAARIAIVKPLPSSLRIVARLNAGRCSFGSELLMVYRFPMVFTFMFRSFTMKIPTNTAISEPGIFLLMKGQTISTARLTRPTIRA